MRTLDEKLKPGVKLTDGQHLYEVVVSIKGETILEDCAEPTDDPVHIRVDSWRLRAPPWELVKPAA